jgi:hypothetical protein
VGAVEIKKAKRAAISLTLLYLRGMYSAQAEFCSRIRLLQNG